MNIVERPSYTSKDVEVTSREPLFSGFIQVEKVSLRHRLFNQSEYTPVLQRELVHRPEAAGVLLYNDQQQFALIEQFRVGALDDPIHHGNEIIAGVLDGNESPESCIRREP
jgi:ADP-ribose pyrophosphatase